MSSNDEIVQQIADDTTDINNAFSNIFLSENKLVEASYAKGYKQGASEFNFEAYHLGYHRGAELGAEIGYYSSFTESYAQYYATTKPNQVGGGGGDSDKIRKTLNNLTQLIASFPTQNDTTIDYLMLLNDIRAKFKKLTALLKVTDAAAAFTETDRLSF